MAETPHPSVWGNAAAYDACIGRRGRPVGERFLAWLALPPGLRWVDVGCGTGALTQVILEAAHPRDLLGVDPSPELIAAAHAQLVDPRVRWMIGDAGTLPVPDAASDAVVAGLVLNHVPDPTVAVAEMVRVVRPSGSVAAYVWDYAGQMQMIRAFWAAATAIDPAATAFDQGVQFPLSRPEPFASLFTAAGLRNVSVQAIDVPTVFQDFADYWQPHLLGGSAIAQRYVAMLEDRQRAALREHLRATLPIAGDGSIPLIARAWAVQATRP